MLKNTPNINSDFAPFVTVYMPAYNAVATIREALDSILNQTYENFEIVVINDGSTDDTSKIISEYKRANKITAIDHMTNKGIAATYNEIYDICKSDFICIYHADDVYKPQILEKSVAVLKGDKDIGICFSLSSGLQKHAPDNFRQSNSDIVIFNKQKLFLALMKYYNFIVCPTACIRTSTIKSVNLKWGKIDLSPRLVQGDSGTDLQMWLDLASISNLAIINEPLINWRQHPDQMSRTTKKGLKTVSDFVNVIEYNIDNRYVQDIPIHAKENFNLIKFKEINIAALNAFLDFDEKSYLSNISAAQIILGDMNYSYIFDGWARKKIFKYVIFHYFLRGCYVFKHHRFMKKLKSKYFSEF